jgi:hypothetical protein
VADRADGDVVEHYGPDEAWTEGQELARSKGVKWLYEYWKVWDSKSSGCVHESGGEMESS